MAVIGVVALFILLGIIAVMWAAGSMTLVNLTGKDATKLSGASQASEHPA